MRRVLPALLAVLRPKPVDDLTARLPPKDYPQALANLVQKELHGSFLLFEEGIVIDEVTWEGSTLIVRAHNYINRIGSVSLPDFARHRESELPFSDVVKGIENELVKQIGIGYMD